MLFTLTVICMLVAEGAHRTMTTIAIANTGSSRSRLANMVSLSP